MTSKEPVNKQLLKLILSIAMSSVTEHTMSILKSIKAYLCNSVTNRKLSSLSIISIEKELSSKCSQDLVFKFLFFFTNENRCLELVYKKKKKNYLIFIIFKEMIEKSFFCLALLITASHLQKSS